MRARIDAGTDVAMIGAWDAQQNASPFTPAEVADHQNSLERDVSQGSLVLIRTGGDGGGPVDLYIDEPAPPEVLARVTPVGSKARLSLPTGALTVGGVEDYRSADARITGPASIVSVPAGDYAVRCYVATDPEQEPASEKTLRRLVSAADIKYYDSVNQRGCVVGALTLLLFPLLSYPLGWRVALPITIVAFLAFFPLLQWALKRNPRYQRLNAIIPIHRIQQANPTYVFELRRHELPDLARDDTSP
jgi:hypothetical protein